MAENDDIIDLNKLSQKELLIITHNKVVDMGKKMDKISDKQEKHEVRISVIEHKAAVLGAIFGTIAGAVMGFAKNWLDKV